MGIHTSDSQGISSSSLGNSESLGEAAIFMIAIGSIFIILCVASIVFGLQRRRNRRMRISKSAFRGISTAAVEPPSPNPTDFMKSLATWDRCHSIDEILEKRRRSAWTLEVFENYGPSDVKTVIKSEPQDPES